MYVMNKTLSFNETLSFYKLSNTNAHFKEATHFSAVQKTRTTSILGMTLVTLRKIFRMGGGKKRQNGTDTNLIK